MLRFKLLTCKEVAHIASSYADGEAGSALSLKIRFHLLMCENCTRFMKHLKTTKKLTTSLLESSQQQLNQVEAEDALAAIKQRQAH